MAKMGSNFDKVPKVENIDFPFKRSLYSEKNSSKPYYYQIFEDINHANPIEKQFLVSQVIDIFKMCFPAVANYNNIISYYFYFHEAKSVYLIFVIDKKTNLVQGFQLNVIIEERLEEGNRSEANTYTVAKGIVGTRPEYRQTGLYKEITLLFIFHVLRKLGQRNFICFDLVINPVIFYFAQKITKWVYPGLIKEISRKQMEFFVRLKKRLLFTPASESNPILVQAMTSLTDSEIQYWRKSYSKIPKEMKFVIDQTKLEKNVGVAYMAIINMIEGNTLGLPAGVYLDMVDLKVEAFEHSFISPKL